MTENLLVWVLLLPLLGGVGALFGKLVKPMERLLCWMGTAFLAASAVFLYVLLKPVLAGSTLQYALGGWPEPFGISLVMDGMAWISCGLTTVVALAVAVYSLGSGRYGSRFFS